MASWAGRCPGNKESGGKRLSGPTRKGNRWLRRGRCQAAWGASRKKDCFLNAFFQRHKAKQGAQKAIIATARRLLVIAYCILRDGTTYQERGADFYDQLHAARTRERLIVRLRRLGVQVTISSPVPPVPPAPISQALPPEPPAKALASSPAIKRKRDARVSAPTVSYPVLTRCLSLQHPSRQHPSRHLPSRRSSRKGGGNNYLVDSEWL